MDENSSNFGRRSVLKSIGAAGVGLLGVGSATATSGQSDIVSRGTARKVAQNKVEAVQTREQFSSWQGATVEKASVFYGANGGQGPEYVPTAYVFAVTNRGEDVGYVTASARSDWAPVLEYSTATPPNHLVDKAESDAAAGLGVGSTGRVLYHGGVKYGLELEDGRAVNVRNGRPTEVGRDFDPSAMSFKPETIQRQQDAVESDEVTTDFHWDTIYDVPAWTEHDGTHNKDYTYYGTGDDSWDKWDGCVPVAASMLIAYHEGYDEEDTWTREYYIDKLHDDMNTNDAGSTWPTDIDNGFNKFAEGSYDYDGTNIYLWSHPNFTKKEITDNNRPFLLNMNDGGTANDRNQTYGDHTTTVVGYGSDGDELELHDTWDDDYHYLTWGSWSACSYTKVTKS
jgi:hypothetical protein